MPWLFAGSGCAALICEIVWFQLLELVIGSSAVSMALLLGTFMGGMGIGNLVLPRAIGTGRHPLRVYAALELAVAVSAVLVWFALPAIGRRYAESAGMGGADYLWRGVVCVLLLLPPTACMGATLPVIARWTRTARQGVASLGVCYAANLGGAVIGCLLAGFLLLRAFDLAVAAGCAVGLDLVVALAALLAARSGPGSWPVAAGAGAPGGRSPSRSVVGWAHLAIGLSGFCALVGQVVWTRLLALMLGGTTYTFSIILAVYLTGLGIGGAVGAALARRVSRPGNALGWCQLLQVFAIGWADDLMLRTLPFWTSGNAPDIGAWTRFGSDLVRCGYALLPATLVWGASFPLALAAGSDEEAEPGRSVGGIYAANTSGAVLGALLAGLVLLPRLGTARIETLLFGVTLVAALVVVRPAGARAWGALVLVLGLAFGLAMKPAAMPWQLAAYGRHAAEGDPTARPLYLGEGAQATVAVTQSLAGNRYYHIDGKTEASSQFNDMRLQRMLGHLPALLHPNPRSVLVVGLGAGVTAGSLVVHPSVQRLVVCEIEPLVVQRVAAFFAEENHHVLDSPKVEVVCDDARHYLATTRETFDLITSDPIHPWVKGAARLYAAEYLELCRRHLKPGGLVSQWIPFYQSSREAVQSELATFFSVFPEGTVWGNDAGGSGYDALVIGGSGPASIDIDAVRNRLARPDSDEVRRSLAEVGISSTADLLGTYAGRAGELRDWLGSAEINRDRSLRLEFLAGLAINSRSGAAAYHELLERRRFPVDLFRGSEPAVRILRERLPDPAGVPGP